MLHSTLDKLIKNKWIVFIYTLIKSFENTACREKAASLTYTTTLAIVPVLTVFIFILSRIPSLNHTKDQILSWMYSNVLPQTGIKITTYLNQFAEKSADLTLIGIMFLVLTTLMLLAKIEHVFDVIWQVPKEERNINNLTFLNFVMYLITLVFVPLFLGLAFALSSAVASFNILNQAVAGYSIDWSVWLEIFSSVISIIGIVAVYCLVPSRSVPFASALVAGIVVGVLFEATKSIFGFFMLNFTSYELIYGAFAALPLLLLWIYFSWCLLLFGVILQVALVNSQNKPDLKNINTLE